MKSTPDSKTRPPQPGPPFHRPFQPPGGWSALSGFGLLALLLAFPWQTSAQSRRTANTLKLDSPENAPTARIADVSWLVGHWRAEALGGSAEEIWVPSAARAMMGMYRLVRADSVVFYELMTIAEEKDTLVLRLKHFNPDLTGWEERTASVSYPLIRMEPQAVFFEGLTYKKVDTNTIDVFLVFREGEELIERKFVYRRDSP